jgi:hypothetical protein
MQILFGIGVVVLCIACVAGAALIQGIPMLNEPLPQNYVAQPGECFVPPQGDPVYDQFYANQVNPQNCQAFENQSQGFVNKSTAEVYSAQAEAIHVQTDKTFTEMVMNAIGAIVTVLLTIVVVAIFVIGLSRG